MIDIISIFALSLGFLHGFVVWGLVFSTVRPIVLRILQDEAEHLRVASAVTHVLVLLFLIVCAITLLSIFGRVVTAEPSKELKGLLFIGSFFGWIFSGLIPLVESRLRRFKR